MAKEAEMMETTRRSYNLNFSEFAINFDVDIPMSVLTTKDYDSYGNNFAYAVCQIWLKVNGRDHLLSPQVNPGNFLEESKEWLSHLMNPPAIPNLESIIGRGEWCAWMHGYWKNIELGSATSEDDARYEVLIPLSIMESRKGHIAVYKYNDVATIEVATRTKDWNSFTSVCAQFDTVATVSAMKRIQELIAEAVLTLAHPTE